LYAANVQCVGCTFNVVFIANKSKCPCCHPNGTTKHSTQDACLGSPLLLIGSQLIEFVDKWPHLGHIITNDLMDMDEILATNLFSLFDKSIKSHTASLKLIVKQVPDSSKPTAQVSMELNCGICLKKIRYYAYMASSKYDAFCSHTRPKRYHACRC